MINRKIFEVVTARASASEQCQLIEGIVSQAFKYSTDIIVISNIYNASEYNDFITEEGIVMEDIQFDSPSTLAQVATISSVNGKVELKDSEGRLLKELL